MRALRDAVGTELLLVPSVAAIVRDPNGRVLLQRRRDDGSWGLPAGAIDPGEAPARALVREVWEETGLIVAPERIAGVFGGADGFRFVYPNGDRIETTVVVFECRVLGGQLGGRDDETAELCYFAPDEMPGLAAGYPRVLFDTATIREAEFQWDPGWSERDLDADASKMEVPDTHPAGGT
jgi:8-oxo-dGTP pyrophosphatase MutT (NUDIX family)